MSTLLWIILATFLISLISFIGILVLILKENFLNKILLFLVALAAGALIGGAFLHLLPETLEKIPVSDAFLFVLIGFSLFFLIEKFLHWRHCHDGKCSIHSFAYMNLFGDGVHNFIDGLIIAASFIVNVKIGVVSSFAVILHEIPQEIGDFGVLIYGGFNKIKALFFNFITALTAMVGGILGYFVSGYTQGSIIYLLPFAAGGFIYIAASDLIPELRKEINLWKSLIIFIIFLAGIAIMKLI